MKSIPDLWIEIKAKFIILAFQIWGIAGLVSYMSWNLGLQEIVTDILLT